MNGFSVLDTCEGLSCSLNRLQRWTTGLNEVGSTGRKPECCYVKQASGNGHPNCAGIAVLYSLYEWC